MTVVPLRIDPKETIHVDAEAPADNANGDCVANLTDEVKAQRKNGYTHEGSDENVSDVAKCIGEDAGNVRKSQPDVISPGKPSVPEDKPKEDGDVIVLDQLFEPAVENPTVIPSHLEIIKIDRDPTKNNKTKRRIARPNRGFRKNPTDQTEYHNKR
ncbi:hypothetical protein NQ317_002108 [Molorchus minor]|uniref:Uncharacterized protein n=1 Tax=Molorchus minor TaxID=1323400 RepID=A0ABQ9JX02_9CUCU|nr:hypothetical protein NQ317_002108 [Molorchus minor]